MRNMLAGRFDTILVLMTAYRNCLMLLALGACATGIARAEIPEYLIQIKNRTFVPEEVHVPAGIKVRIVVVNLGTTAEEFDSHALNREKLVRPGARISLFLGPLEPGRYLFQGESREHPDAPALGVLVVQ